MTALALAVGGFFGVLLLGAVGDLVSEEIRGWLDLAPRAILRLATLRVDPGLRERIHQDEWLPDLMYYLRGAEARPITRLIRGTTFAFGLLLAARGIARYHVPAIQPTAEPPQGSYSAVLYFELAEVEVDVVPRLLPLKPGEFISAPHRHPPASH